MFSCFKCHPPISALKARVPEAIIGGNIEVGLCTTKVINGVRDFRCLF